MADPTETVQAIVARVLWECDEGAGWSMSAETRAEYVDRAAAVVTALGIVQVPDLGLWGHGRYVDGIPFGAEVKAGEGYHGTFPLSDDDLPVFRIKAAEAGHSGSSAP